MTLQYLIYPDRMGSKCKKSVRCVCAPENRPKFYHRVAHSPTPRSRYLSLVLFPTGMPWSASLKALPCTPASSLPFLVLLRSRHRRWDHNRRCTLQHSHRMPDTRLPQVSSCFLLDTTFRLIRDLHTSPPCEERAFCTSFSPSPTSEPVAASTCA